jgi:hypothetical protein
VGLGWFGQKKRKFSSILAVCFIKTRKHFSKIKWTGKYYFVLFEIRKRWELLYKIVGII